MDSLTLLMLFGGLLLLTAGGELLVRGASKLAQAVGISPLVVGLTVVAFGTSSPELAVSVNAALSGNADIAVGNVVGSNIFNILFILGLSAIIVPLVVAQQLIRTEVPIMIGVSILMWILSLGGHLSRWEGIVLFAGILFYTFYLIRASRKERKEIREEYEQEFGASPTRSARAILVQILLIVGGLVLLVLGSGWLVDGAIAMARALGVSELVIGLTIIAAGTSLPEVATSVIAAVRKERDIAVGNVIGSNIFNILCVLGLTSVVSPAGINVSPAALAFDIPVMTAVAVASLPILFTGHQIARWEGFVLLFYYVAYTLYLVLDAAGHDALPMYSMIMLWFVLPLTVLTLALGVARAFLKGQRL